MAVDLNIPAAPDEDGDPLVHLPGGQDIQAPAAGHPVGHGDGDGPPAFDLNMEAYDSDDVDWFNAPAVAANFDLNIDLEEEGSDDDADVYAEDFQVTFDEEELQGSSNQAHVEQDDVFNGPNEAATFDLNNGLEDEGLQGSSDEENVQQGNQAQEANMVVKRKNLKDHERHQIYEALLLRSNRG
ncbi:hypothetical protein ACP70R_047466 [Stipagrostis hirtigluma subsp. patula]